MNLSTVQDFRHDVYSCFPRAADALFNTVDALLTETQAHSFPELSLSPLFERRWGSLYEAFEDGRIDQERLRRVFAKYLLQPVAGKQMWLGIDATSIDAQPHLFPRDWLQQILRKYPAQPLLVNASIFERFIQTPPAPLEQRRERQLRKRVGLRLGQQCIHGVEQGVSRSGKTAVHVVTKVLHCAKVHLSNAPVLDLPEHYSLGQSFVKRTALLSKLV